MATNSVFNSGTVIPVAAPSGGVSSGDLVVIRSLYGIANVDAASGARVDIECAPGAVKTVPADTNLQIDVGDRVFWDSGNGWVDKTATAQLCVGIAVPLDTLADIASATTATTVRVLMTGTTPAGT